MSKRQSPSDENGQDALDTYDCAKNDGNGGVHRPHRRHTCAQEVDAFRGLAWHDDVPHMATLSFDASLGDEDQI